MAKQQNAFLPLSIISNLLFRNPSIIRECWDSVANRDQHSDLAAFGTMATFYIFVLSAISVYKSTVSISLMRGAASLSWLHNPIIICLSPGSSKIFLLSPAQSWSDRRLRFQRLLQSAIFSPAPRPPPPDILTSAANRLIGEVVQSRRRPLLGPSPDWKRLLALSHLRHY